ncbi:MAG: hypothetical protein WBG95_05965 [Sulfitobacter sp.]
MENIEQFKQHLQQAYSSYLKLDGDGKHAAFEMAVTLLRKMLRDSSGQKQRLAELGSTAKSGSAKRTHAEKARAKLTRKSNAQSPQSPLKPVKTTSKNELRRK